MGIEEGRPDRSSLLKYPSLFTQLPMHVLSRLAPSSLSTLFPLLSSLALSSFLPEIARVSYGASVVVWLYSLKKGIQRRLEMLVWDEACVYTHSTSPALPRLYHLYLRRSLLSLPSSHTNPRPSLSTITQCHRITSTRSGVPAPSQLTTSPKWKADLQKGNCPICLLYLRFTEEAKKTQSRAGKGMARFLSGELSITKKQIFFGVQQRC